VTKIAADTPCERCGGKLLPPELMPPVITSDRERPRPDYVCMKCGQAYRWSDDRKQLVPWTG